MKRIISLMVCVLFIFGFILPALAEDTPATPTGVESTNETELADIENNREAIINDIVEWWRETMEAREGTEGWEQELTAALNSAPADKLLAARKARTYEEVGAALFGAWQGPELQILAPGDAPAAFGSTSTDLVFTPLTPCRIIDTRFAAGGFAGRIGPNAGKAFQVNISNFSLQGGRNGACGIPTSLEVSGVVINVASTDQTGSGHLRVIQAGGGIPTAAVVNYSSGVNISNTVLARSGVVAGNDIYIYSGVSASHVVVDLMGYFAAPNRTRPDNYVAYSSTVNVGNNLNGTIYSPTCLFGFRLSGGGHIIDSWANNVTLISSRPVDGATSGYVNGTNLADRWVVQVRNYSGASRPVRAFAVCIRVPGR